MARASRPRPVGVLLAFARDGRGALAPVAALDATTRRTRAPFTCPGCGDRLVARLGARRARHFAHRPGSACPLTSPETALHFNTKARLLALCGEALAGRRRVTLLTRCAACRRADPRDLAALGDEALSEGAVGSLRADVLVRRAGAPALALEVLVTHAVDAAKEAALATTGVPAVEVDAREAWERETAGGAVEVACARSLGFPPCAACRTAVRADADRALGGEAAEVAELESYRARGLLVVSRPDPAATGRTAPSARVAREAREARCRTSPNKTSPKLPSSQGDLDMPISPSERADLAARFRCPECRTSSLLWGSRLVRHACPAQPPRPVGWRGYDGRLAVLRWWKR